MTEFGDGRVDDLLRLGGQAGETQHGVVGRRIDLGTEPGQQLVSDSIASVSGFGVRGVLAPGLAQFAEVVDDFLATALEERADERQGRGQASDSRHAGQSGDPSPASDAMQDGFNLVVGRVGDGQVAGAVSMSDLAQELVPKIPEVCFTGVHRWVDGGARGVARQIQAFGERFDGREIGVGFGAAQAVVQVGDDESTAVGRVDVVTQAVQSA